MSWKPAAPRSEKIIRNATAKQNEIQQKASEQKPEAFLDRFVLALSRIHYKIKVTQK